MHDDQAVITMPRCDESALLQGEGEDETVVVVGVFADQVHPPGGEPDSLRVGSRQLPVAGGQLLNGLHRSPFLKSGILWVGQMLSGVGCLPAIGKYRPHAPKALFIRSAVCC